MNADEVEPEDAVVLALRAPGDERQLTSCFTRLAAVDPGIRVGIARSLLECVDTPLVSERAAALASKMPADIEFKGEAATGKTAGKGLLERWRPTKGPKSGLIDWMLGDPKRWQLAVEVKVKAELGERQLDRYHRALTARSSGLLLLAKTPPRKGLPDPKTRDRYLGVVLWEQVLPRLEQIDPTDSALKHPWLSLLRVLALQDDLGSPVPDWASIGHAPSSAQRRRALELIRPEVESDLKKIAEPRVSKSRPAEVLRVRVGGKGKADCAKAFVYIPVSDKRNAIEIELLPARAGLRLRFVFKPLKVGKQGRAQKAAAAKLLAGEYTGTPTVLKREFRIPRDTSIDVRVTLKKTLVDEVGAVLSAGLFDPDLNKS